MSSPLTLIVIVNYCSAHWVIRCLNSLADEVLAAPPFRAVIVDNNSPDDSRAILTSILQRNGWHRWVTFLPLNTNLGFGHGNNIAVAHSLRSHGMPEYLFFLNPDTLVPQHTIAHLVDFMDTRPHVGIAGATLVNAEGVTQRSAHRFPTLWSEFLAGARLRLTDRLLHRYLTSFSAGQRPCPCDWVPGAAMIVRTNTFLSIRGFDEQYFLYRDEVDLCYRARRAGWLVYSLPEAMVGHHQGVTTGITRLNERRTRHWFESRRRFFLKHHGLYYLLLADLLWCIGRFARFLRCIIRAGGNDADPAFFARDMLVGDLATTFRACIFGIDPCPER